MHSVLLKKLKRLDRGAGRVKADTLFNLLEDSGVCLSAEDEMKLRLEFGDSIEYSKAVKSLWYLRDSHEWIYNPAAEFEQD